MSTPIIKNRVGMTVSGTPGTGTITLSTALTGYQSFPTAYAANATVDILIEDGDAWEIARDCTYTHSGTTVSRGTFEASSSGSALTLTSAAKVYVIASAHRLSGPIHEGRAALSGYGLEWLAATGSIIRAKPGYCVINGRTLLERAVCEAARASTESSEDRARRGQEGCYRASSACSDS